MENFQNDSDNNDHGGDGSKNKEEKGAVKLLNSSLLCSWQY